MRKRAHRLAEMDLATLHRTASSKAQRLARIAPCEYAAEIKLGAYKSFLASYDVWHADIFIRSGG